MSVSIPSKPSGGYEVVRPHGKCVITGQAIEPGEKFMTALRDTATGLERVDVCLTAWPDFPHADALAYWQVTMPHPDQKKKLLVDDAVLVDLFERLGSAFESHKIDFRFVLGLILIRKRLLVYEQSRTEGEQDIWIVRPRGREDRLELINPKIDDTRITEVSRQMGEILNSEL